MLSSFQKMIRRLFLDGQTARVLTDWEENFLLSIFRMSRYRDPELSPKQAAVLERIRAKVGSAGRKT